MLPSGKSRASPSGVTTETAGCVGRRHSRIARAPIDTSSLARRAHDQPIAAQERRSQIDAAEGCGPRRREAKLRRVAKARHRRGQGSRTGAVHLGARVDLHVVARDIAQPLVESAKRAAERRQAEILLLRRIGDARARVRALFQS